MSGKRRITRQQMQEELDKARNQRGVGATEQQMLLTAMLLQVQLDILDALDDVLQVVSGISVERK